MKKPRIQRGLMATNNSERLRVFRLNVHNSCKLDLLVRRQHTDRKLYELARFEGISDSSSGTAGANACHPAKHSASLGWEMPSATPIRSGGW